MSWTEFMKLRRHKLYFKIPLRSPRVASFADIIQNATTMVIKTTFKDAEIVKRIRSYALKCNPYLYFLI